MRSTMRWESVFIACRCRHHGYWPHLMAKNEVQPGRLEPLFAMSDGDGLLARQSSLRPAPRERVGACTCCARSTSCPDSIKPICEGRRAEAHGAKGGPVRRELWPGNTPTEKLSKTTPCKVARRSPLCAISQNILTRRANHGHDGNLAQSARRIRPCSGSGDHRRLNCQRAIVD